MNAVDVTREQLVDFVQAEARLLDAKRFDDWNTLFTDDAFYWLPATPDQPDPDNWTSHLYEDKLLRDVRIERLKSARAFSQQPPSRCHHLLQLPHILPDRRCDRTRHIIFVGEIQLRFDHRARMNQPLSPTKVKHALRPGRVPHGKTPLRLRLGVDQVGQRLGFGQVEPAVQESAPGEFSRLGMAHSRDRSQLVK